MSANSESSGSVKSILDKRDPSYNDDFKNLLQSMLEKSSWYKSANSDGARAYTHTHTQSRSISAKVSTGESCNKCSFSKCTPTRLFIDPDGGTVIEESGNYILCNSVDMTLANRGAPTKPVVLLTIRADNVSVNLNGHVLRGNGEQTVAESAYHWTNDPNVAASSAILIEGRENVTIFNGTLEWFSNYGIAVFACRDVTIRDLKFNYVGSVFIPMFSNFAVDYTGAIIVFGSHLINVVNIKSYQARGHVVALTQTNASVIDGVQALDSLGAQVFYSLGDFNVPDSLKYGFYSLPIYVENILLPFFVYDKIVYDVVSSGNIVRNCTFQGTRALYLMFNVLFFDSKPFYGLQFEDYTGSLIENVQVVDIALPGAVGPGADSGIICEIRGIAVEIFTRGAIVRNCNVTKVVSNLESGGGNVPQTSCTGINVCCSSNVTVENCNVSEMDSKFHFAFGFGFDANDSRFGGLQWINCSARAIRNTVSPAAGFQLFPTASSNFLYKNCIASEISGVNRLFMSSAGFLSGPTVFYDAGKPDRAVETNLVTYDNCQSLRNNGDGFLLLSVGKNCVFRNCIANTNTRNGYRVLSSNVQFIENDALASGQNGYLLDTVTAILNGVPTQFTAKECTLRGNIADHSGARGFYDKGTNNWLEGNRAFASGTQNFDSPNVSTALNTLVNVVLGSPVSPSPVGTVQNVGVSLP